MRWVAGLLVVNATLAHADEPAIPSVMDKRWSASMGYGVALARAQTDNPNTAPLFDFHFGIRFRVIPDLQVGLLLGGAFEGPGDGYAELCGDVRYSLLAERPWNPYLLGAIGFGFAGEQGSGARSFVRAGAGIERRFESWAVSGEMHLSRIGGDDEVVGDDEIARFGALSGAVNLVVHYHWGGSRRVRRFVP